MRRWIWAILILCGGLLVMAPPAWAFRCGSSLVQEGDYKFEVLNKCGSPDIEEHVGYVLDRRGNREKEIVQWIYGPQQGLYYILHFEGATLKRIEKRLKR
jgi:hypothetical protein